MELTPPLLRARIVRLFELVAAQHGPIEGIEWELVRCDRCGWTVHLLRDGFPSGWTTTGDAEHGWTDLCRGCSQ